MHKDFILCVAFPLRSQGTPRLFFLEPQRHNRHKGCTKVLLKVFIATKARRIQDAQNFILCVVFSLRSPCTPRLIFFLNHKGTIDTKVAQRFYGISLLTRRPENKKQRCPRGESFFNHNERKEYTKIPQRHGELSRRCWC
jgi:hypothetical protein